MLFCSFFIEKTPEIPPEVLEKVRVSKMMVSFFAKNEQNSMAYKTVKMLLDAIKEYL